MRLSEEERTEKKFDCPGCKKPIDLMLGYASTAQTQSLPPILHPRKKLKRWQVVLILLLALWVVGTLIQGIEKHGASSASRSKEDATDAYFARIAGEYVGTSEMGSSTGSASLTINPNGTAFLKYAQEGDGMALENGLLNKDGQSLKFKSLNGGGTYDLQVSGKTIVLNGYHWRCVLSK